MLPDVRRAALANGWIGGIQRLAALADELVARASGIDDVLAFENPAIGERGDRHRSGAAAERDLVRRVAAGMTACSTRTAASATTVGDIDHLGGHEGGECADFTSDSNTLGASPRSQVGTYKAMTTPAFSATTSRKCWRESSASVATDGIPVRSSRRAGACGRRRGRPEVAANLRVPELRGHDLIEQDGRLRQVNWSESPGCASSILPACQRVGARTLTPLTTWSTNGPRRRLSAAEVRATITVEAATTTPNSTATMRAGHSTMRRDGDSTTPRIAPASRPPPCAHWSVTG